VLAEGTVPNLSNNITVTTTLALSEVLQQQSNIGESHRRSSWRRIPAAAYMIKPISFPAMPVAGALFALSRLLWTCADHIPSAPQVQAVFLAAAVEPAAGSPVRRQYGPSAPADAVAGQTLPAALPQPVQLAPPAMPLSALLPSPIMLQPTPMPSRALELARLHQAWQQKHFKRMPLSQYLYGRWAGPVWVPQRDVPGGGGRDAASATAPVQTGPAAAAADPSSEHVQEPARLASADAASAAAADEEPDADGEPAPRSAHRNRQERQQAARQARLRAKAKKDKETKAQRLKRHVAKRVAKQQRQSAQQQADDGIAASADDNATDSNDASELPRALLPGQPLAPSRCPLTQQPAARPAATEPVQREQPASLPTQYDPWQDVDSPHPARLLPRTSASAEDAAAEQDAPAVAVAAPAAAVTDAAERESEPESGELQACCDAWDEAPHACGDSAPRLIFEPGQDAQPRTGDQAPLLLPKPKKRKLNKAQRFKRRLEKLARFAAQREAAQQKRQSVQQRADHGAAASADDDASDTDHASETPCALMPGQPSEPSRPLLLGQQPAAGSAAAEPAQAEQPVSLPVYDPWQDADRPHTATLLPHTSATVQPAADAQDAPAYDPWEEDESSQGLQMPTTVEQWSPIVHRDGERVDPPAQAVALQASPPQTAPSPAGLGLRHAVPAAPDAALSDERSQQQPGQPSAAAVGYDPWEKDVSDAAQLAAKASSANEQPGQPAEKQPSAAAADYDPWVDVEG